MDLDELERHARTSPDIGVHGDVLLTLIARVRAAEAERDRLRALFDEAGQGEHNVLALVDHYQEEARKALIDREEAYPRALQAAADVVLRCEPHTLADLDSSEAMEWIDNLANDILELSAAQIDAFAAE